MKKTILSLSTVAVMTMTSSAQAFNIAEILVGIGAGLISKEVCEGLGANSNWQTVCAIGGGLLGAEVARKINEQDAQEIQRAQEDAFRGGVNSRHDWDGSRRGSRSGYRGDLIVVQEGYHYQTRETCRVLKNEIYYPGNRSRNRPNEVHTSTVCRRSNGSVYTLDRTDYFRNGRYTGSQSVETETRGRGPVVRPRPAPLRCDGWSANGLRRGDVVYTTYGESGTFQGSNNYDNTVAVRTNGSIRTLSYDDIAIKGCFYGYQSGEVVTYGNSRVTVVGIFRNGDLAVRVNGRVERANPRWIYR
jgi:hypothetical protein